MPGDPLRRDNGDADGDAGIGLHVHELGRGVQRDQTTTRRPGGCGEKLQRDVHGEAAGGADGPPYTLTVTPPVGGKVRGAGIRCGAGGDGVFGDDAGGDDGGDPGDGERGLHVLGVVGATAAGAPASSLAG